MVHWTHQTWQHIALCVVSSSLRHHLSNKKLDRYVYAQSNNYLKIIFIVSVVSGEAGKTTHYAFDPAPIFRIRRIVSV